MWSIRVANSINAIIAVDQWIGKDDSIGEKRREKEADDDGRVRDNGSKRPNGMHLHDVSLRIPLMTLITN